MSVVVAVMMGAAMAVAHRIFAYARAIFRLMDDAFFFEGFNGTIKRYAIEIVQMLLKIFIR